MSLVARLCRPAAVADKGKTFILETYKLLKVLYREVVRRIIAFVTCTPQQYLLAKRVQSWHSLRTFGPSELHGRLYVSYENVCTRL